MSRERNFVKNTFILGSGTVLPKIFGLITVPILTACLSKTEYGTYDLIMISVTLFLPLATLQMQAAGFRFLIEARGDITRQKQYITNILSFTFYTSIIALGVLYLCLFKLPHIIRILIVIYYFVDVFYITLQQIARGLGKNKLYVKSIFISSFLELFLIFILLRFIGAGLIGALVAIACAALVSCLFLFYILKIHLFFNYKYNSKSILKELLGYSWPLIPNSLSSWMVRLSNRFIITFFLGIEANAIYAVANKLPNIFGLIQGAFSMAWQENATIASKDEDSSTYYSQMFRLNFRFLISVLAVMIAFTPLFFKLLIRGDYETAYPQIPILYASVFLGCISSFLGGIYIAKMKTKELATTTLAAALVNILLCIAFSSAIGLYASSCSICLSYLLLDIYRMKKIKKFMNIDYHYKEMTIMSIFVILIGFLCLVRNIYIDAVNIIISIIFFFTINRIVINKLINGLKTKRITDRWKRNEK